MRRTLFSSWVVGIAASAVFGGDIMSDGDFDALAVASPPDCAAFAGAWGWPQLYIDNLLCEVQPQQYSVVPTDSFDPEATGNSLHHFVSDLTALANFHLPNVWNQTINESDGVIVTVLFDIWVETVDISGGHIYVGGDHGGGGFSNLTDRGPQLTWFADGTLSANEFAGVDDLGNALPPNVIDLVAYTVAAWQSVRVEIDLATDTFDVYHGAPGSELVQVGDDLLYRVAAMDHVDRFTVVHFGATEDRDRAYIDNIVVCTDDCPDEPPVVCEGDANADNVVDPLDSGYVLSRFGCSVGTGDPACDAADVNLDGIVDPLDSGFVLSRFGDCPAAITAPESPRPVQAPMILDWTGAGSPAGL